MTVFIKECNRTSVQRYRRKFSLAISRPCTLNLLVHMLEDFAVPASQYINKSNEHSNEQVLAAEYYSTVLPDMAHCQFVPLYL